MVRILVCTQEFPPKASGIGNVIKYVTTELKNKGYECVICSPTGPDIRLDKLEFVHKFGGLGLLSFWLEVVWHFNHIDSNFDIVWLHNPLFLQPCPFPRIILTFHGMYHQFTNIVSKKLTNSCFRKIYYKIMSHVERFNLRQLYWSRVTFTCVGQNTINILRSIGIKEITFIPNGVDNKKYLPSENKSQVRSKFGIPRDATVFLSLGRLTHHKMPLKMIDVFGALENWDNKSFLLVIGKGELLQKVKDYAKSKMIRNAIFLGFVDNESLPSIISSADYYLTTSVYEGGQPTLAMLETMACGLAPIVPSEIAGNLITETKCGVAFNSVQDILSYLETSNQKEQSKSARKYAEEHDWAIIADKYANLFMKHMAARARSQP